MKKWTAILFCIFSVGAHAELPISQVVLWGHKLHSHTHSYIHGAFVRAFQAMGYKTLWLDNSDDVSNIDFAHTLFITEGQVDQGMPLRSDSWYVLHNCDNQKYGAFLDNGRAIVLQVYTHDVLERAATRIAPFIYKDVPQKTLYMPWASDLLPGEIKDIQASLPREKQKTITWVGTIGGGRFGNIDEINGFKRAAEENGFAFEHRGHLSLEENIEVTQKSYMSPAIQGPWQVEKGYIPCRIFKAISYGQMGVTNSQAVWELFERKIVYNPDTHALFNDAQSKMSSMPLSEQLALMDFVRENHTYVNRIRTLLEFLESVGMKSSKEEL